MTASWSAGACLVKWTRGMMENGGVAPAASNPRPGLLARGWPNTLLAAPTGRITCVTARIYESACDHASRAPLALGAAADLQFRPSERAGPPVRLALRGRRDDRVRRRRRPGACGSRDHRFARLPRRERQGG